jgi:hypothetical protein
MSGELEKGWPQNRNDHCTFVERFMNLSKYMIYHKKRTYPSTQILVYNKKSTDSNRYWSLPFLCILKVCPHIVDRPSIDVDWTVHNASIIIITHCFDSMEAWHNFTSSIDGRSTMFGRIFRFLKIDYQIFLWFDPFQEKFRLPVQ